MLAEIRIMGNEATDTKKDLVIVVHGFSAMRIAMWPLAWRLRRAGFRVKYWGYPSVFGTIEPRAKRFREFLLSTLRDENRIHVVAHSMGCIVLRAALSDTVMMNLGRIVMLAPPNRGSPIARFITVLLGWIPLTTRDLSSAPTSYVNRIRDNPELNIGIIAARHDILIPVPNTMLTHQTAHEVVAGTHNSILVSSKVATDVVMFLRNGSFDAKNNPSL